MTLLLESQNRMLYLSPQVPLCLEEKPYSEYQQTLERSKGITETLGVFYRNVDQCIWNTLWQLYNNGGLKIRLQRNKAYTRSKICVVLSTYGAAMVGTEGVVGQCLRSSVNVQELLKVR